MKNDLQGLNLKIEKLPFQGSTVVVLVSLNCVFVSTTCLGQVLSRSLDHHPNHNHRLHLTRTRCRWSYSKFNFFSNYKKSKIFFFCEKKTKKIKNILVRKEGKFPKEKNYLQGGNGSITMILCLRSARQWWGSRELKNWANFSFEKMSLGMSEFTTWWLSG